jgi:hypothetical protein
MSVRVSALALALRRTPKSPRIHWTYLPLRAARGPAGAAGAVPEEPPADAQRADASVLARLVAKVQAKGTAAMEEVQESLAGKHKENPASFSGRLFSVLVRYARRAAVPGGPC